MRKCINMLGSRNFGPPSSDQLPPLSHFETMIFVIYFAVTTLIATLATISLPDNIHFALWSQLSSISGSWPSNVLIGIPTHTHPIQLTLDAILDAPLCDVQDSLVSHAALTLSSAAFRETKHLIMPTLPIISLCFLFISVGMLLCVRKSRSPLHPVTRVYECPAAISVSDETQYPLEAIA